MEQILRKYDLIHLTKKKAPRINVDYHAVHIYQLQALYSITGKSFLKNYCLQWQSYVSDQTIFLDRLEDKE